MLGVCTWLVYHDFYIVTSPSPTIPRAEATVPWPAIASRRWRRGAVPMPPSAPCRIMGFFGIKHQRGTPRTRPYRMWSTFTYGGNWKIPPFFIGTSTNYMQWFWDNMGKIIAGFHDSMEKYHDFFCCAMMIRIEQPMMWGKHGKTMWETAHDWEWSMILFMSAPFSWE